MKHASQLQRAVLGLGLALLAASAAQAQGYVGGGVGPTRINIDCAGFDSCDKTGTGGKLYGGYLFAPQFGVELGYFNWGKAKARGTFEVVDGETEPITVTGTGEVKGDGIGVGVAYIASFTPQWSGVARLGVARNKGKTTLRVSGQSESDSFNSTEAYFGFGAGYNVTSNLTVTGEADFSRLKYAEGEKASVRLFTVGLRYKF
jgi:OmpA-OmpF porin, OOP family